MEYNKFFWVYFPPAVILSLMGLLVDNRLIWISGMILYIPLFVYGIGETIKLRREILRLEGESRAIEKMNKRMKKAFPKIWDKKRRKK